jgi:hypothetical protein
MSTQLSVSRPTDSAGGADRRLFSSVDTPYFGASVITYGTLIKSHLELLSNGLRVKGKTRQLVLNHRSAINRWMSGRYSEETPVGKELGADFDTSLYAHLETLASEGKSRNTINARKTILRRFRETWVQLARTQMRTALPRGFSDALMFLKEKHGVTYEELARHVQVKGPRPIEVWAKGLCIPGTKSLRAVSLLERYFELPEGTLMSRLPRVVWGGAGRVKHGLTPYRRHLQKKRAEPYRLKSLPPGLANDWHQLVRFYTDSAWARLQNKKRTSYWRVREEDGRCPTAELMSGFISSYFGYLCLPRAENPKEGGKGFKPDELSLALLSDSTLIYDYLEFKRERTYLKSHNSQTRVLLNFCCAILRPETGFLWQSPEFAGRLPKLIPEAEWHAWCKRHRDILKDFCKDFEKQEKFKQTHDPFEGVRSIIMNEQHPIDVLLDLADAIESDTPPRNFSPHGRAAHFQNLLLVRFATNVPLRVFNFSIMTYRPDNTGHLYQRADGSWWLRFIPEQFKNQKGAANKKNSYDVPVDESLRRYIEEYLFVHRPNLMGADKCDYVFRPVTCNPHTKPLERVLEGTLSLRMYTLTQLYIPNCPGFRMHAVRHLVATEYIKNRPDGYAVAAAVLHDREKTVRDAYAWVLPKDKIEFWNKYHQEQKERHRREKDADSAEAK